MKTKGAVVVQNYCAGDSRDFSIMAATLLYQTRYFLSKAWQSRKESTMKLFQSRKFTWLVSGLIIAQLLAACGVLPVSMQ
jgi:hypothetical protein